MTTYKFLETMERVGEGLPVIPKAIGTIILFCFTIWFNIVMFGSMIVAPLLLFGWDTKDGLLKSVIEWVAWLCFGVHQLPWK
jgi:hypothetical protein